MAMYERQRMANKTTKTQVTLYSPAFSPLAMTALLLVLPLSHLLSEGADWFGMLLFGLWLAVEAYLLCRYLRSEIFRVDTKRGMIVRARWRWGWHSLQQYPLAGFRAVQVERIDNINGGYGRLWLRAAEGGEDLLMVPRFVPYKSQWGELKALQQKITRHTGLPAAPLIRQRSELAQISAAHPEHLRRRLPQPDILGQQLLRLLFTPLWLWLALFGGRKAWAMWDEHPGLACLVWLFAAAVVCLVAADWFKQLDLWLQRERAKQDLRLLRGNRLPPRTAARHDADITIYSVATLLSRLPFLLFAALMLWGSLADMDMQSILLWLGLSLSLGGRLLWRWRELRKLYYAAAADRIMRYRLHGWRWEEERVFNVADFCGIYCTNGGTEIWLAGQAGGCDCCLLQSDSMMRDNRKTAAQTAAQLSRATGLPLVEYAGGDGMKAT